MKSGHADSDVNNDGVLDWDEVVEALWRWRGLRQPRLRLQVVAIVVAVSWCLVAAAAVVCSFVIS